MKRNTWRKTTIIAWTLFCLIAVYGVSSLLYPISAPEAKTTSTLTAIPGSFSGLAKGASPSVVNISQGAGKGPFTVWPK
jgi:hypothetical protein